MRGRPISGPAHGKFLTLSEYEPPQTMFCAKNSLYLALLVAVLAASLHGKSTASAGGAAAQSGYY